MGKIRVVEGTIQEIGREKVTEGEDYEISLSKLMESVLEMSDAKNSSARF